MEHNIDRSDAKEAMELAMDPGSALPAGSDQANDDQGLIILPAIAAEKKATPSSRTASKIAPEAQQKKPAQTNNKQQVPIKSILQPDLKAHEPTNDAHQISADYLPEYHAPTNGLRELLSTIDPQDLAGRLPSPQTNSFEAQLEANLIENAMHLPHSRSGLPGSPDLPIGPTRWGLYLSSMVGALAFLFISALAYSHINSPTGINWTKAKSGTSQFWHNMNAAWSGEKRTLQTSTQIAEIKLPEPLQIDKKLGQINKISGGTLIATNSRISTTAATAQKGAIAPPAAHEIFVSQKELEEQILAFEAKSVPTRDNKKIAALKRPEIQRPAFAPKAPSIDSFTHGKSPDFDQLVVIPSTKIDPLMENQIFERARSYLQQHDISSARMILQYAASLGSGLSAMALAETFDPNYKASINLPNVDSSRTDARKWYYMASRLGIDEAKARLTALK